MELRAVGDVPPVDWGRLAEVERVVSTSVAADGISTVLEQLSLPAIAEILTRIDLRLLDTSPPSAESRMIDARLAATVGDVPRMVTIVMDLIREFPAMTESLRHEAAFQNQRIEVEGAIRATIAEMRDTTHTKIEAAAGHLENALPIPVAVDGTNTGIMLALAVRFYEAGRVPDLVRASALADRVIELHRRGGTGWSSRAAEWMSTTARSARKLWARAPLLILLVGWLFLGMMGYIGPTALATGLLGLVGFGFVSRVWNVRS